MTDDTISSKATSIYDTCDDRFFHKGLETLTKVELNIVAVGSFIGQMRSGGIRSFIESPWGILRTHVTSALREVGLISYASIAAELLANADHVDLDDRDSTDEIEAKFWKEFWKSPEGGTEMIDKAMVDYWTAHH